MLVFKSIFSDLKGLILKVKLMYIVLKVNASNVIVNKVFNTEKAISCGVFKNTI